MSAGEEGTPLLPTGARAAKRAGGVAGWAAERPWIWSFLAALLAWVAISVIAGRGWIGTITSTFGLVPFLVLVGIGQMVVITLGDGNIDLSLPNTLTLAAYVSTGMMNGGNGSTLLGFLVPVLIALLIGAVNSALILLLRIPPIVATLSVGLMLQSAVLIYSSSLQATVDTDVVAFTRFRVFGLSLLGLICVGLAVAAGFVLFRTSYGRSVQAIGQKIQAARLTGIPVTRVIVSSYLVSSVFAAVAGVLLGAFSTPNLDLGQPYLLNSIAVVVLGGSLIAGGRSNVTGIWGSSLFLLLLLTFLDTIGASVAVQNIVKGALIILVLLLVGARRNE